MNIILKKIVFSFLFVICFSGVVLAQVLPSNLTNLKASELSDADINEFIQKYKAEGYTLNQVGQGAIQKGMPIDEWNKLQERIKKLDVDQKEENEASLSRTVSEEFSQPPQSKTQNQIQAQLPLADLLLEKEEKPKIFGASLFNRDITTFEPNLRLATPADYQIGPEDDLIIDIYGLAENSYRLSVSPEGFIRVPNVGLVQVSGMSIDQAKRTIAKKLSAIYTTINSNQTSVSVTLGNIRSIKVIIIGEVYQPGTYTLPSVASIFNALNAAGGPNDNGSFRDIRLIRDNQVIAKIDIYDFLLKGELKNNLRLQDQDVIRIEPYINRIELEGEVKNIGIFEAIEGEPFSKIISYAGGFTNNAYKEKVTVLRNTNKERSVANVSNEQFSDFVVQNGDHFIIGKILDRFLNRVQIEGAVYRPGVFALEPNMTIKSLIDRAEGVTEDAFLSRAIIVREQKDKTKEMLSFNVEQLLNGKIEDIRLKKEDSIYISPISRMKEEFRISIWGEVQNEGDYIFIEKMTLNDLVFIAGGLTEKAELREIEVSRLVKNPDVLKSNKKRTESFILSINQGLKASDGMGEFLLESSDQVIVRPISGFEAAKRVKVDGEVYYPGSYILTSKNERISDVIKRAGGLNQYAYAGGSFLIRNQKNTAAERKLEMTVFAGVAQGDTLVDKDSFLSNEGIIGIDLMRILQSPGSKWDLILEEGDVVNIPRQLETVQVSGEVFLPVFVRYDESLSFTDYVGNAGGFARNAMKRKSFVVYANGTARSTKNFLFFKKYPKVTPGARIYVPTKPERQGLSTGEAISIATSTTSLAAVIMSMIKTVF